MSIATTSIKYGWVYLTILTIGTGTFFVTNSTMRKLGLKDRIEVTLAVVERCYALQTGTNPVTYSVAPPSIVRTWYDSNGVPETVTNALEWRDDLSMKVDLDAKIIALCPYYVDTNSVYDGTINIIMHTFTGLLTSLNLGDGTNFTSIPCWTNNVGQTNCTTNAATFGPWAWRNYRVAWQERYKVLNALTTLPAMKHWIGLTNFVGGNIMRGATYYGSMSMARSKSDEEYPSGVYYPWPAMAGVMGGTYNILMDCSPFGGSSKAWYITMGAVGNYGELQLDSYYGTNKILFQAEVTFDAAPNSVKVLNCFQGGSYGMGYGYEAVTFEYTSTSFSMSAILQEYETGTFGGVAYFRFLIIMNPPFQYCTDRYW